MIKVMYTFEPSDPFRDEIKQRLHFDMHLDLLSKLSEEGVNSLNIAILGVARFIISLFPQNETNVKRYEDAFGKVFIENELIDKNIIDSNNNMCLVERISDGESYYYQPLRSWQIDTNLAKAKLMRKLDRLPLSEKDREYIESYYGIGSCPTYMIGGADESSVADFINKYNHYLYEFYKRNEIVDPKLLNKYDERKTLRAMPFVFYNSRDEINARFNIDVNMFSSVEASYLEIDDICNSIKFFTRRLYELNYPEMLLFHGSSRGNKHYSKKFKLWDRYLRIYDLYKEQIDAGNDMTSKVIDKIGRTIANEFNYYPKSKPNSRRATIEAEYQEAVKLIKQSSAGYLL